MPTDAATRNEQNKRNIYNPSVPKNARYMGKQVTISEGDSISARGAVISIYDDICIKSSGELEQKSSKKQNISDNPPAHMFIVRNYQSKNFSAGILKSGTTLYRGLKCAILDEPYKISYKYTGRDPTWFGDYDVAADYARTHLLEYETIRPLVLMNLTDPNSLFFVLQMITMSTTNQTKKNVEEAYIKYATGINTPPDGLEKLCKIINSVEPEKEMCKFHAAERKQHQTVSKTGELIRCSIKDVDTKIASILKKYCGFVDGYFTVKQQNYNGGFFHSEICLFESHGNVNIIYNYGGLPSAR
jgi:hypothetical protein